MNERERYIETLRFGSPDKIPMITMGPREPTLERWQKEGLPAGADWFPEMCRQLGIDYDFPKKERIRLGVSLKMMPIFEEKILEHKNGHYIMQDWMGNIVEISDEFDFSYIREAKSFVTRKWHGFPVENTSDFASMKKRYNPDEPGRFPEDFKERCKKVKDRDYPLNLSIPGPFWQMREWCGFEPLCIMFIERPELIEEMCAFWSDYIAAMLERICDVIAVDCIHLSEDMAYKGASMISPAMTRTYLMPVWERWGKIVKQAGVPLYSMDSDGLVDDWIPLWIESGFGSCDPLEVAAGCDINNYRKQYGRKIAYSGGIDKRCMAKGGIIIEDEMRRIEPVVKNGGYIPGCDHGIPHDISWPNMLQFGRLWANLTGWL